MIKCPNCGSTAQMKLVFSDHFYLTMVIEKWECGCGCKVERKCEETDRIITFPNSGVKYEKRDK